MTCMSGQPARVDRRSTRWSFEAVYILRNPRHTRTPSRHRAAPARARRASPSRVTDSGECTRLRNLDHTFPVFSCFLGGLAHAAPFRKGLIVLFRLRLLSFMISCTTKCTRTVAHSLGAKVAEQAVGPHLHCPPARPQEIAPCPVRLRHPPVRECDSGGVEQAVRVPHASRG